MEGKKGDRDAAQQKTFTKWVNTQLKRGRYEPVDDLLTCWKTGWKLAQLTAALYGVKMRKLKKVAKLKLKPHYMDNISVAMEMLEKDAEVKTNFLKGEHLWEGDKKMMLGMVWAIILDHAIKGIKFEEDGASATAKQGLLLWVQKQTKGYRDVDPPGVKNFHTSWKDGMALCALIHKFDPSLIDYDSLDKANAKENCEKAIKIAEEKLDIPAYVEAADLYDTARPDEKVVMTYVAEFFHKFGSLGEKQAALRRVNQFVQFQRNIWKLQTDYNQRAEDLMKWADSKIKEYNECQLGETQPEANAKLQALKDYLKNIKPGKAVEKMDIESLYGEIQSTLRINNRAPFKPNANLAPDVLHNQWQKLQQAEAKYGAACRDHAFAFIKKIEYKVTAEQMKEFEDSFNHFDSNSDGTLNPDEFKAALAALSIAFKEEEAFKKVFAKVSGGNESISKEQYLDYMRLVSEDKGTPEQLMASFEALADGKPTITSEQLNLIGEEDRKFLLEHMEAAEAKDTYNYKDLVGKSFA